MGDPSDLDDAALLHEAERNQRDLDVLLASQTSAQALRGLYTLRKDANRKYSFAYYCREAKIPSTGYLSDVLTGKRILALKYKKALVAALGLKAEKARFLKLLIDHDNESAGARRERLAKRIVLARKVLHITYRSVPLDQHGFFQALEVYCAFSLFDNEPTMAQLVAYFGPERQAEVATALDSLVAMKLAAPEGKHFRHLTNHVVFGDGQSGLSHVDFLKLAIAHAMENIDCWFPRKDESYLASSVLSVDFESYKRNLVDLRQLILTKQAELETAPADALIRFNVQIYPLNRPPSGQDQTAIRHSQKPSRGE